MFWTDIPDGAGDYAILPDKVRGEGTNVFNSSENTLDEAGTVVTDGAGTVTVGYYDSASESAAFHAFAEGLMSLSDAYVRHGKGCRLAAQVTGASSLRIGYLGASN